MREHCSTMIMLCRTSFIRVRNGVKSKVGDRKGSFCTWDKMGRVQIPCAIMSISYKRINVNVIPKTLSFIGKK